MYRQSFIASALFFSSFFIQAGESTLIAPMLGGFGICKEAIANPSIKTGEEAQAFCREIGVSSAEMLDDYLTQLGPKVSPNGAFELGYMMGMPLLSYIKLDEGELTVDRSKIRGDLRMLEQSDRKAVVYLFANHFVSYGYMEQAKAIAESSDQELMQLSDGELPVDKYFSSAIYPWRLGDDTTLFSKARDLALDTVLEEVCAMPTEVQEKIAAFTTLGEVHHFFRNFKGGMGYGNDYQVTDYSPQSVRAFQSWLMNRFANISELNNLLHSEFQSFQEVFPPSKNKYQQTISHRYEHLDPFAHGVLPFFGWAFSKTNTPFNVNVYVDGQLAGQADVNMSRVDVAQALDELDDSNVGYRYDLDFSQLSRGNHDVELRFVQNGEESLLKSYVVQVDNNVEPWFAMPAFIRSLWQKVVPSENNDIRFWADHPSSEITVAFNPLAKLWLEFREYQVTHEIENYADRVASSCIASDKVFSHQVAPSFNPSWDPTLFAVEGSLEQNDHYQLGINLYGGVTYGDFFFDWLERHGHKRYGLPEMHTMSVLPPEQLAQALQRHHDSGAVFISPYFMSIVPEKYGRDPEHDKFKLLPDNKEYGSDKLYQAIKLIMNQ